MKHKFVLKKFASGMHYIQFEEEIILEFLKKNQKRLICKINEEIEIHSAIMKKKEGGYYINIGSKVCKKLNLVEGSKLTVSFSEDNTIYQFEMPIELQKVLDTDSEANKIFHSLTKGNQRSLIYLVVQAKSSSKKNERSIRIVAKIKKGITSAKLIL